MNSVVCLCWWVFADDQAHVCAYVWRPQIVIMYLHQPFSSYLAGPGVPPLASKFQGTWVMGWVAQTGTQGPSCLLCSAVTLTLMESRMCSLRQGASHCSTSCSFSLTYSRQLLETEESPLKKIPYLWIFWLLFLAFVFYLDTSKLKKIKKSIRDSSNSSHNLNENKHTRFPD